MKNIWKIILISKPLHKIAGIIAVLIVFTALLDLATPIFSKFIVDEIVNQISGNTGNINILIGLIGLTFIVSITGLILTVITERLGDHFAGELRRFLTEKFYDKALALPQSYYDSEISGRILNQLNRGIQSIENFINTSTNFLIPMFLQSIFTIVILAYYNIPIAIAIFVLFPIYGVISYYSAKKWGEEEILKNQIEDKYRGRIQEVIGNIRLVKGFSQQSHEYKTASKHLTESNKIYARQSKAFHIYDFIRGLSLNIILLIVNIIVFMNAFRGTLSIGEMVLILQLVNQARRPLFAMSFILSRIHTAESGSKEFFEILALPGNDGYKSNKKYNKIKSPTIKFSDVSFKYDTSENVLNNISFTVGSNESIALVGHSGAGKSTIINLILRLYEPTSGNIYLNNKPYSALDTLFIRHNIALVFQENELFSSTIKENVAYGTKATDKEIIEALKKANAWGFVEQLPKQLESEIGERGVKLSGGQKQRIQIARAILKNAPILILDEATSSLDAKSEKEVQDALENLMKDKLVIIIAHRFSTLQNVDKIIVIDGGKIVDYGKPKELSKKKGVYSELLNYQIEGDKKLLEQFDIY